MLPVGAGDTPCCAPLTSAPAKTTRLVPVLPDQIRLISTRDLLTELLNHRVQPENRISRAPRNPDKPSRPGSPTMAYRVRIPHAARHFLAHTHNRTRDNDIDAQA